MATTYLNRTIGSSSTLSTKATISFWVKKSLIDSSTNFYGILSSNGGWNDGTGFAIGWREDLLVWYNLAEGSGLRTFTNRKFRDTSAFYHIVYKIDTTQASMQDRVTLYVNGEDQGDLTSNGSITTAMPSQNANLYYFLDNGDTCQISRGGNAGSTYFDGLMTHFHFIDGTAYPASTFGETDSLTGIWKPITSPSVTYGTNGFFLKFASSGSMGTDSSGNSNNFTVNGNLTQTQDTPSNVFATYNPLGNFFPADTFSNGNTTQTTNAGNYTYNISTLGASNGKYYCEIKNSTNNNNSIGIADRPSISTTNGLTGTTYGWAYVMSGQVYNNGSIVATYNTVTTNDIVGIALDLDNNKVYFSKNGTWQGSSDPSAGTGGISITAPASNRTGFYFFGSGDEATNSAVHNANFGNGYFGTTAVASAGTNASGIGIFEYDVPTGYTALSTKGLNL